MLYLTENDIRGNKQQLYVEDREGEVLISYKDSIGYVKVDLKKDHRLEIDFKYDDLNATVDIKYEDNIIEVIKNKKIRTEWLKNKEVTYYIIQSYRSSGVMLFKDYIRSLIIVTLDYIGRLESLYGKLDGMKPYFSYYDYRTDRSFVEGDKTYYNYHTFRYTRHFIEDIKEEVIHTQKYTK